MMDKEGAKIAQKIYNKLSRIRTERDNYRAVLEGAGYRDLDLLKKETRDCRQIGIEAHKRTQKIIDERNELKAQLEAVKGALDVEEINPANYDHDLVMEMLNGVIEAWTILYPADRALNPGKDGG